VRNPRQGEDSEPGLGKRIWNEKADVLAGKAAEKPGYSKVMSLAHEISMCKDGYCN
jgi:hypothetical protein